MQSKEFLRALRDFQELLLLDPLDGDSYADRGLARVSLGRLPEALLDAEEALKYGEPTYRRYFASIRIYSLASTATAAEIPTKGRAARFLSDKYQGRAEELLVEAMKRFPHDWGQVRRELQTDRDLRRIRWRLGPASKPAGSIDFRPSPKATSSK
jgi:tetratricopeptide (TPR) repeat protein